MKGALIGTGGIAALLCAGQAWAQVPEPGADAQEAVATIPVESAADSPAALAEQADAGRSRVDIGEIVVTAQKREESINDVPISISAFSGDALEDLGVTDTRDLGNLVPGFSYADSGYTVPIYSLRGVGFNESSQTASSTVGLYLDEQSLAFPVFSKGANLDLERVEVLKGPQGTLYGRNTTGGLVNYIANKPTDQFEASFNGSYSRFDTLDVEGAVSGPLSETLRGRAAYRSIHAGEGWQKSITREDGDPSPRLGEIDKQAGRFILEWLPSDVVKTTLTFNGWKDDSEPQAPQAIGFQPQNPITGGLIGDLALLYEVHAHPLVPFDTDNVRIADWPEEIPWKLNETFWMGALRTDWAVDDETDAVFLGSYADFENDHSLVPQSGLSIVNTERELIVDTQAYAFEGRLSGRWNEEVRWLAGAYLSHDEVYEYQSIFIDSNSAAFIIPSTPIVGAVVGSPIANRVDSYGEQEADTYAFFGSIDWQFQPTLTLNLGARYTSEVREFEGCSIDSPSSTRGLGFSAAFTAIALARPLLIPGSNIPTEFAKPNGCFTLDHETNNAGLYRGKLDEDNVAGRVALDWTPADDLLFYASYSRGFKSGSFPVFPSSDQAQYIPVKQEQLDAYEIGGKTAFLDRRLRVNFAGFYYDYKDKQLVGRLLDPIFGPLQKLVNAPKSEVRGVELEVQVRPMRGLLLAASAIYLKTELKEFEGVDQSGDPVDLNGEPFNFSPELEYTLIADYNLPLNERLEMMLGADYSYTDETNSVLTRDPLFAIEDYGLLNARVGVGESTGAWKVTVWGQNVTNEYYQNGVFNTGDTVGRYAGRPRILGVTLTLRFD